MGPPAAPKGSMAQKTTAPRAPALVLYRAHNGTWRERGRGTKAAPIGAQTKRKAASSNPLAASSSQSHPAASQEQPPEDQGQGKGKGRGKGKRPGHYNAQGIWVGRNKGRKRPGWAALQKINKQIKPLAQDAK